MSSGGAPGRGSLWGSGVTGNGGDASRTKLNRALPGMYVDKIVFGLPDKEACNYRALYSACISIAMSAQRRGWSEAAFINEVAGDKSRLWLQLRTQRDGRLRSSASAYRVLHKAWDTAIANLHDVGVRIAYDISQDARERALHWTDRLTDRADGLSDAQSAVMSYVVAETHRRGMLRVTCPGRDVAEFAKVPHRTVARTLKTLARKGFLIKHYAGRGGPSSTGKAAIYELADPGHPLYGLGATPVAHRETRSRRHI
jgi:hypothetical protein